jgi:hypothetical protein
VNAHHRIARLSDFLNWLWGRYIMEEVRNRDLQATQDEALLKQYGLRWAVLAAWRDALQLRQVPLPVETDRLLENARIKIASGCFSVCEVGCDLSQLEAALTSFDASSQHNWVDFWVDMLGHSMSSEAETQRILKIPAVLSRYKNCGLAVCRC